MAEDWDLFAIVRSCQSATTTIPQTTTNNTSSPLITSTVKEENYDGFSFPNIVQPITNEFQALHQLFTPFNPTTNTTNTSASGINPNSPYFAEQESQQISEHLPIWPHFVPEHSSTPSFSRFHDHQQQQQQINQLQALQKHEFQLPQNNSPTVSPNAQPQTPKSRKRYQLYHQSSITNFILLFHKNSIFPFSIPFSCFTEKANRRKWYAM